MGHSSEALGKDYRKRFSGFVLVSMQNVILFVFLKPLVI
jgi:hypothetical protein